MDALSLLSQCHTVRTRGAKWIIIAESNRSILYRMVPGELIGFNYNLSAVNLQRPYHLHACVEARPTSTRPTLDTIAVMSPSMTAPPSHRRLPPTRLFVSVGMMAVMVCESFVDGLQMSVWRNAGQGGEADVSTVAGLGNLTWPEALHDTTFSALVLG